MQEVDVSYCKYHIYIYNYSIYKCSVHTASIATIRHSAQYKACGRLQDDVETGRHLRDLETVIVNFQSLDLWRGVKKLAICIWRKKKLKDDER